MIIGTIKTIFDLDINYLKEQGIKALISDLDQTLSSAFSSLPEDRVYILKKELEENGIKLFIISNNFKKRVKNYCEKLDVNYLSFALKFTSLRVKKWLKKQNLKVEDCIFVGDQLRTDGKLTNKLHARLILTTPLDKKDNICTKIFRKKDLKYIQKLKKENKLGIELPQKGGTNNVL